MNKKEEKNEWKADPELIMKITNNVTRKDILLLTGFMIAVSSIIVGIHFIL